MRMINAPLITVYIPSRNYGRFLKTAVDSVINQLYENWELFIFDEGSDDDTLEIARYFQRKLGDKVSVFTASKPEGLQTIANKALRLSKGKYILRLDADDWLDENALLVMSAKLESDSSLGLVYANYHYTNEAGHVIGMERRLRLWEEDKSGHFPPHGACTLVRNRSLKAVGGYTVGISAQDGWELWYKLRDRVNSASIDVPLFYYRQHGNSLSKDHERLLRARAKIFEKISASQRGDYKPQVLAVVPVKESFPNFPGVPFQRIGEHSLLKLAIDSVHECSQVSEVMMVSASQAVLDFALELEAKGSVGHHKREFREQEPAESLDVVGTLKFAAEKYYADHEEFPDILLIASIHAIGRTAIHVEEAINMLLITESDSVVTVQEEREPIFRHGLEGIELLNPGRFDGLSLSKDREKIYKFNGGIIGVWWEIIANGGTLGDIISSVEMSVNESRQVKNIIDIEKLHS